MNNIASNIINKFGGASEVAKILNLEPSGVYKWTYPKERMGRSGVIPAKHHHRLMIAASELNIDLSPNDFFDLDPANQTKH